MLSLKTVSALFSSNQFARDSNRFLKKPRIILRSAFSISFKFLLAVPIGRDWPDKRIIENEKTFRRIQVSDTVKYITKSVEFLGQIPVK